MITEQKPGHTGIELITKERRKFTLNGGDMGHYLGRLRQEREDNGESTDSLDTLDDLRERE